MKNLKVLLIIISSIAVIYSCKKTENDNITQPANKSSHLMASGDGIEARDTLAIGQKFGGGIIAYILQRGDPGYKKGETHGLIAATVDQSDSAVWCPRRFDIKFLGVTDTLLGSGRANTNKIISKCGAGTYAAKIARDYKGGGYTDWYLPSSHELRLLWSNIGQGSTLGNVGGFAGYYYWSSSEYEYYFYSFDIFFTNGFEFYDFYYGTFYVRAIRAF